MTPTCRCCHRPFQEADADEVLADEATGGRVLISQRLYAEVESDVDVEPAGEFTLKGFGRPAAAFDVVAVRSP